jgi:hypothetical protein
MSELKTVLTIGEIYTLESEINGIFDQKTGEKTFKGLLANPLNMKDRFWLTELLESIAPYKKRVDELKNELILKFGEDDGVEGKTLKMFNDIVQEDGSVSKEVNPKFLEFNDEMNALFVETKTISHRQFNIEAFDFKTDETYPVFFKILKAKKEDSSAVAAE